MKAPKRNAKGRKVTRAVADKIHSIVLALHSLTDEELRQCDEDVMALSSSNCWYVEHQYRQTIGGDKPRATSV